MVPDSAPAQRAQTCIVPGLAGTLIPNPQQLGLSLVVPLAFLAVLAPQIRSRPAVIVVLVSVAVALACATVVPGGVAVLIVLSTA